MVQVTKYPHGTISWMDGMSTDLQTDIAFYQALFGWDVEKHGDYYALFKKDGASVAGLGQMPQTMQNEGYKSHWMTYVTVDDIDEVAQRARDLGATFLTEPHDVGESGRTAVFKDPVGGMCGIWQAKDMIGAERINEDGTMVWNEISTWDGEQSHDFYTKLFGWTSKKLEEYDSGYWMLYNNGRANGGILQMTQDWDGIDNHWMNYIHVDDIEANVAKVEINGGKIVFQTDSEDIGKLALISVPTGAQITLIQMNNIDQWVE